jgi:ParB-like chromosome segregation protein Spo0J
MPTLRAVRLVEAGQRRAAHVADELERGQHDEDQVPGVDEQEVGQDDDVGHLEDLVPMIDE